MIQRIQSLFLLGVVIISIILCFVPLSQKTKIDVTTGRQTVSELRMIAGDNPMNTRNPSDISRMGLLLLNLVIMAGAAFALFKYRNRKTQMQLCAVNVLLAGLMLVLIFFLSEKLEGATHVTYQVGTYLVLIQVVLLLAARRGIRKDEMLVRSADRIR